MKRTKLFSEHDMKWEPSWWEKIKIQFLGCKFRFSSARDGVEHVVEGYEYKGCYYVFRTYQRTRSYKLNTKYSAFKKSGPCPLKRDYQYNGFEFPRNRTFNVLGEEREYDRLQR